MATQDEEAALTGEPTFEAISPGRVRCLETGHDLLESDKDGYKSTKKCREALFDRALREGKYPLSFFEQSPDYRDRMVCKITGAIVNKNEKAVWKHVLGKSFTKKLSLKEEEKKGNDEKSEPEVAKSKTKKQKNATQEEDENDDRDFWVPPQADIEMEPQTNESHEASLLDPATEKKTKKNRKKNGKHETHEPNGLLENAEKHENTDVAKLKRKNKKNKNKHEIEQLSEIPEDDKKKSKKNRKVQETEHLPGETMGEVDGTRKRMKRMALEQFPKQKEETENGKLSLLFNTQGNNY